MKAIVSVNQLSISRAVLIWYCGRRSEDDHISPNTNLNISQDTVTNLSRHETPHLFDLASTTRPRSVHNWNSSFEFKSWIQVSRKAGVSKPVEVGQYFVTRPVALLRKEGNYHYVSLLNSLKTSNQYDGHFMVLDMTKWCERLIDKPKGQWNSIAEILM